MKDLIRKILKEEQEEDDDFAWIRDVIPQELSAQLDPIEVYYLYGFDNPSLKSHVAKDYEQQFSDIVVKGDKIMLVVDDWVDFKPLFSDSDRAYSRVNQYLIEQIFSEDYWEPYDNVNETWGTIWEYVTDSGRLTDHILNYIKDFITPENYNPNQLDIYGELPKKRNITYIGDKVFDKEYFNYLSQNLDKLGEILDEDNYLFNDLGREIYWAYNEAYNRVVLNNIYHAATDAITDIFGGGEWQEIERRGGRQRHMRVFDITDLFWSMLTDYYSAEIGRCEIPADKRGDIDYLRQSCYYDEPFSDYGNFIDFYHGIVDPELNPSFDDYAYGGDLIEQFEEAIYSRI